MRLLSLTVISFFVFAFAGFAHSDEPATSDSAAVNTASLVGRVLYDGTPPEPRNLRIPLTKSYFRDGRQVETEELPERRRIKDAGVPDESLIVGDDHGLANVIIWVRSKDVPAPPQSGPLPAARVCAVDGRFDPHVLVFWIAAPMKWINASGSGINFNWTGPFNQQNRVLNDGQTVEIPISRPSSVPTSLASNIHPWMLGYILPLAHPYFAVTGRDGRFEIKKLPAGKWEFAMWHERSGWLETDKFSQGRFTLDIKRGTNDLAELHVDPLMFKK